MKVMETDLPGVLLIKPRVFKDERGFFLESFNQRTWNQATGMDTCFVQDNHSHSCQGVLRGIHYQIHQPQAKLVRVVQGEVFDVAVDLRRSSPCFGKWYGVRLSADNHLQLYIPQGFGHGFLVLSGPGRLSLIGNQQNFMAPQIYKAAGFFLGTDPEPLTFAWALNKAPFVSRQDRVRPKWAGNFFPKNFPKALSPFSSCGPGNREGAH